MALCCWIWASVSESASRMFSALMPMSYESAIWSSVCVSPDPLFSLTLSSFCISCFLVIFLLSISFLSRLSNASISSPWFWFLWESLLSCWLPPISFKNESTSLILLSLLYSFSWTLMECCFWLCLMWSRLSEGMWLTLWWCCWLGRGGVARTSEAGKILWPTADEWLWMFS